MSITLTDVRSGYNLSSINDNFQKIEDELNDNVLRRDGLDVGEDNAMHVPLDMNVNRLLNVADAVVNSDGVNLGQVQSLILGGGTTPSDGVVPKIANRQIADGVQTVFQSPSTQSLPPESFFVHLSGVKQRPTLDYAIDVSGNVVFVEAPGNGLEVDIILFEPINIGSDVALKSDLAEESGASTIGVQGGETVQKSLDSKALQADLDESNIEFELFRDGIVRGRSADNTNIMVIGDSITQGIFSGSALANNQFFLSYIYRSMRSVFNHTGRGLTSDPGRLYETNANMFFGAWFEPGMPGNGGAVSSAAVTFPNEGLVEKQLSIPSGEWIEITLREVDRIGFFYDGSSASHSATGATVDLNGAQIGTLTTVGATAGSHSGYVVTPFGKDTELTDTLRITATGGTLIVSGITMYKASTLGPRCYSVGWSGRTFDDFNTNAKLDELATMLNFEVSASNRRLVVLALGSNSIYQAARAQTPEDYITSLNNLIVEIQTRATNTSFLLTVPPRANPAFHNIEIGGGVAYEDYRDAILTYAASNGYGVIRYDTSVISEAPYIYYNDGLHPTADGHEIMAREFVDTIGVPYDNYIKTVDFRHQILKRFEFDIDSFPGQGGAPTIKWVDGAFENERIVSVRLRTPGGTEIQAEAIRDLGANIGMFWQNFGTSTRFFYQSNAGFSRADGYYIDSGIVTAGAPAGYTLVVDYI